MRKNKNVFGNINFCKFKSIWTCKIVKDEVTECLELWIQGWGVLMITSFHHMGFPRVRGECLDGHINSLLWCLFVKGLQIVLFTMSVLICSHWWALGVLMVASIRSWCFTDFADSLKGCSLRQRIEQNILMITFNIKLFFIELVKRLGSSILVLC